MPKGVRSDAPMRKITVRIDEESYETVMRNFTGIGPSAIVNMLFRNLARKIETKIARQVNLNDLPEIELNLEGLPE